MNRKILICFFAATVLLAGTYIAGHYRLLPTQYVQKLKSSLLQETGIDESQTLKLPGGAEFRSTLLTRLLIKTVPLTDYEGSGGGISVTENHLFVVSNKGGVAVYDTDQMNRLAGSVEPAPLNYSALVSSGHTGRNGFREWWFRVNGVYTEKEASGRYRMYVSHNRYDETRDCISHDVSRIDLKLTTGTVEEVTGWSTLFSATPCFDPAPKNYVAAVPYSGHISGGAIQAYDEQHLLITVGDYNHHGLGGMPGFAQDPDVFYGKYVLLNKATGESEIYATGTRNPSGLFIDQPGTIWSVENGPEGGDELNIVRKGANYGWPLESLGIWYSPDYKLQETAKTGTHNSKKFTNPVYSWIPSVAPSSVLRIESDRFPLWKGDLLVGTMRGHAIRRLRLAADNSVLYDEEIKIGQRIRDMTTLKNGIIVLLTDDEYLILLDNGGPAFEELPAGINDRIAELERFNKLSGSTTSPHGSKSAATVFRQNCAFCHSLHPPSGIGPHLANLLEREVGSADDFNYSVVLRSDERLWNSDLLRTFLTDPESEFSGNRMNKVDLSESEVDSLIQYLKQNTPDLK